MHAVTDVTGYGLAGHSLAEWVASGAPGEVDLADWEEVVDPGGGEVDAFIACAHEIVALIDRVAPRL
ncbi:MAG: hypothetical protein O3A28_10035 [Actinomycetota bacterium]|nr:hypothetical protein [Actinomycetota bacterium]MDA3035353.1 hypothetical protein [Actinomycetota bacterium]